MHSPVAARRLLGILSLGLLLVASPGCDTAEPLPETGTVTGQILAPDGVTRGGGATVTLANAAFFRPGPGQEVQALNAPQALTDAEGRFTLEDVPAGEQQIIARRGLFSITFTVNVPPGAIVEAPPESLEQEGTFASIPGAFDNMHQIGEELQIEIDVVNQSIFNDLADASAYGMIFLNCDSQITGTQRRANALAFMQAGGTLYISDLSGDTASALIEGLSAGGDELTTAQSLTAEVVHPPLRNAIGRESVTLVYNFNSWYRILALPANAVVLLRGTPDGVEQPEPLAAVIPVGGGQLVYTTFHNTADLGEDQRALLTYFIFLGGQPEPPA
jgi:hypothetical protein